MELLFVVDTTRLLVAAPLFLNKQSVASQPSKMVEEVSVAEGQKLREQAVVQEMLCVKTWFGVPEVEVAQLRWREPEAQQVAVKMALMMVRTWCVPASEVSQAEIQAACANEQLCGVLLSNFYQSFSLPW